MSDNSELRKLQATIDDLADKVLDRDARIEALEAALRKIAGDMHRDRHTDIARTALAPERK